MDKQDKQFDKAEKARRKREVEGNKTRQERNRSLFFQGVQAIAILGLGFAVASLANSKTYIPVVTVLGADGEVLKQRVIDQDNVDQEQAIIEKTLFDMIRACETFDPKRKQQLSDTCHTYQTQQVAREYEEVTKLASTTKAEQMACLPRWPRFASAVDGRGIGMNPQNPYVLLGENDWIEGQP